MQKYDYKERLKKFIGGLFAVFFVFIAAYSAYLFYIYKTVPELKTKVTGIYNLFSSAQAAVPVKKQSDMANAGWTTINMKTGDETISRLSGMTEKEMKDKLEEAKRYAGLIDGSSLPLLEKITGLFSKDKNNVIISGEDEKEIRAMLEKIISGYKDEYIPE